MDRRALVACAIAASGCGATTVRVEVAPTIDTSGRAGVESTASLGLGLPLDFAGRSHHFFQARAGAGAGLDGETRAAMFVGAFDADYIYWAEPRLDLRAGLHFSMRSAPGAKLYGAGGRLGILPIVVARDGGYLASHLAIGPEIRLERLFGDPARASRGLFSAPLVVEGNFLGAGD